MKTQSDQPNATTLASPKESRELVNKLAATRLFAKYERSFAAASGLPLALRPIGSFQMLACSHRNGNPFCAMMARSRKGCVACLQTQCDLEQATSASSRTARCFANLHDTFVPVRIGRRVIAFLQTGQVALEPVSPSDFDQARSELLFRGIEIDATDARSAYFQSRVMSKEAYQGFVKMLEIFAESLGSAANALILSGSERRESAIVSRAIRYLEQRFGGKVTLGEIAKISGASERHFCKVFKAETGLTFIAYLTRLRVEQAKKRLRETNRQVSEIAFAAGFDSIAQFNRAFKAVAGDSPSEYRKAATS